LKKGVKEAVLPPDRVVVLTQYRATSLIRNRAPLLLKGASC